MPKPLQVFLVLLLVLLIGVIARQQIGVRSLEERLAAAEKRVPARAPAIAVSPAPEEVPAPRPDAPPPRAEPAPKAETPPAAESAPTAATTKFVTSSAAWNLAGRMTTMRRTLNPDLGLSDAQRRMIDELRKNEELQTQAPRAQIRKIQEQTEQAIRQLLDPQQLQKYDAPAAAVEFQTVVAADDPGPGSGRKPGYLGISGADAPGGGVTVTEVMQGSVAGLTGLQPGDVIVEVNGEKLTDFGTLATKIREAGEGVPLNLKVRRKDAEFFQGVQLGPRPR